MNAANPENRNSVPRYLITTAYERTWKFDRPVLFLGEWCRLYDRREVWASMDAIVAEPYGVDEAQKDNDYAYVTKLSEALLVKLRDVLNDYHKTNHDLRYWRIVLGHWLHRYVSVIFNRWFVLRQALRCYEITGSTVLDATSYSLATTDSYSFIWACNDDVWNHVLYSKILAHFGGIRLEMADNSLGNVSGFTNALSISKGRQFKRLVQKTAAGILQTLSRNRDAFIINSYLPKKEEIKLQLSLGQVPQSWRSPIMIPTEPDLALRKRLAPDISGHFELEQCARALLFEALPTCYLEGYQTLNQQVKSLPWPEEPEFIFTSNNFDTDEVFKAWAGWKVEQGTPYFTGQHGNNYGTLKYCASETECVATSDKFITWGWADGNPKHTPAFIFRTAGEKKPKTNGNGGLLLVELRAHHRIDPWDSYSEFHRYQDEQFRFVENLPGCIRKNLTVRLHAEYKWHTWSDEQRWKDRSPNTQVECGSASMRQLISRSRLVVHSYDSTGILETLSSNVPTLCFWHGGLGHLRASALPYYEQLRQAGILFASPEAAAQKVSEVWGNVPAWWNSEEVQNARTSFCGRYARVVIKPIKSMKILLAIHGKNS